MGLLVELSVLFHTQMHVFHWLHHVLLLVKQMILDRLKLNLHRGGFKRKAKLAEKEQTEIKHLYAKWVCGDLRPFSIVEDKGFERLAQMFIESVVIVISGFHRFHI
jgi:hypothetical protein